MPSTQFDKLCNFIVQIFDPCDLATQQLYLNTTPTWVRPSSYQDVLFKIWEKCPEQSCIKSASELREQIVGWIKTGAERFTFNPNKPDAESESELDGLTRICEEMFRTPTC